jgi:hypothetical protein
VSRKVGYRGYDRLDVEEMATMEISSVGTCKHLFDNSDTCPRLGSRRCFWRQKSRPHIRPSIHVFKPAYGPRILARCALRAARWIR